MHKNEIVLIGVPQMYQGEISNIIGQTLKTVRKSFIYTKPISVVVFEAQPQYVIPKIGIAGSAIGKSGIQISINFNRKWNKKKIAIELMASITHETAHLIRENSLGYDSSLLDAMINEGIACYIERDFSPSRSIPYIAPIKREAFFLKKALAIFNKKEFDYSEWFFGSKKIPRWIGYRLGYILVKNYMEKKKCSLEKLIKTKSVNILKLK